MIKNKQKTLWILSFLILLVILCGYTYEFIQSREKINIKNQEAIQFCVDNDYKNTMYEDYCEATINNTNVTIDFWTMFTNTVVFGFNKLSFVLMLFVIIPSLVYVCQYLKNKMILNDLTRETYNSIKLNILKKSYISVLIIPAIIIISFIICFIWTGSFDATYAIQNSTTGWDVNTLNNPILFITMYLLNIVIHSCLYINISLCVARKNHNYFVAVILSFLTIIGIQAFLEIFFNGIIFITVLKSNMGVIFNIMNMITFNDSYGMFFTILVPLILTIISFLVLIKLYKNKENLLIDCEKND